MAICAALSSLASAARWRTLLLGISAAGLLLLGFFAIFSIGFPLMAAGALTLVELIKTLRPGDPSRGPLRKAASTCIAAGGAVLAVALLLGGLSVTELAIRCPASGTMGGSGGPTLLGGSYQYSCNNGALTISR
jgi:hypothetical protein